MWKPLAIAIVVLVSACSGTPDPSTTTLDAPTTTVATTTTAGPTTTASVTTTRNDTTTTTALDTTTTAPSATTTTITAPESNKPPTIEIVSPQHLSSFTASFDTNRNDNGAIVALSAIASDPNGDDFTVTWSSSVQGALGTGESIEVFVSTGGFDASQPIITATATDQWGTSTSASVQIIVWIPSDV